MDNDTNTLSEATQELSTTPISDSSKIQATQAISTVTISDSPKIHTTQDINTTPISDPPKIQAIQEISNTPPISNYTKIEAKPTKKDSGLKTATPIHRLQLPKVSPKVSTLADRCMSPTDLLMSPVSKRLLSRNRKGSGLAAPPRNPSKEVIPLAF